MAQAAKQTATKINVPKLAVTGGRLTVTSINKQTKLTKNEKSFQTTLDRMSVAVASGNFEPNAIAKKMNAELERIKKNEEKAADLNVKFVSDYSTLRDLYNRDCAHITYEKVAADSDNQIKRLIAKRYGTVTKEQENLMTTYFTGRARVTFETIKNIYNILVHKGIIKDDEKVKELEKQAQKFAEQAKKEKEAKAKAEAEAMARERENAPTV